MAAAAAHSPADDSRHHLEGRVVVEKQFHD